MNFCTMFVPKLQPFVQIYATTAVRNRVFKGNSSTKDSSEDEKRADELAGI